MPIELIAPVDVQIELTQECNQACRHCYNFWRPSDFVKKPLKHLSRDELRYIVQELNLNQVLSITITGGEPFVRRNELFELLQMIKGVDIRASINTNFSCVRINDILKLAKEYSHIPLLVSLLSADAKKHELLAGVPKGTHAHLIENIKFAIRHGVSVGINMVLMRENLRDIRETAYLAKSLGVRTFCATKVLPNPYSRNNDFLLSAEEVLWSLKELIEIERILKIPVDILGCYPKCLLINTEAYRRFAHRVCVAGRTTVTIGADGEVRPCSHLSTSYGNIFSESLANIWKKMKGWRNNEFLPKECRDCPIVVQCTGGCRVNTLTLKLNAMDFYAEPRRLLNVSRDQLFSRPLPTDVNQFPNKVMVHQSVRFRNEPFGALFFRPDPWTIILVNQSAAAFLKEVKEKGTSFTYEEFLGYSGAKNEMESQKVKRLYQKLVRKGILVPSNET
jgi:radical SAM protein with 4Fe4S-binding SPASM domain